MANTSIKAAMIFAVLVFLQVSCAVARPRAPGTFLSGIPAVMTVNGFEKGESGGDPSECDGKYQNDKDMLAALSTQWYAGGSRCFKKIRITSSQNGRSVEATVVDECDTPHGCHNNDVDTSAAVWKVLGLDTNISEVPVTWSDV